MASYEDVIENNLPSTSDENWEKVIMGRFPDRYVEGLDRRMAEALWVGVQRQYPGLTVGWGEAQRPTPLYLAAAGYISEHYAIGLSKTIIEQGRACADIARRAIEIALSKIDEIDLIETESQT